jgi:hypothetical protein
MNTAFLLVFLPPLGTMVLNSPYALITGSCSIRLAACGGLFASSIAATEGGYPGRTLPLQPYFATYPFLQRWI